MTIIKKSLFCALTLFIVISLTNCNPITEDDDGSDSSSAKTRTFWLNDANGNTDKWEKITVELVHQNARANVWIKQDEKKQMSQELIDTFGNYFTDTVYANVSNYVYNITEFFDEDGDRINILFYEMDDNTAGYFWQKDFYLDSDLQDSGYDIRSNETNIFYMNINAAVSATNQETATLFTKGTLAHEFQHMAQAHFFTDQYTNKQIYTYLDTWADELCSTTIESIFANQMKIYLSAYNSDSDGSDKLFASGVRLVGWDNYFEQYVAASLFGTYIMSQLSEVKRPNFIKTFLESANDESTQYTLIRALEDSDVAYWSSSTSYTNATAVRDKWASLLDDFVRKGLLGTNADNSANTSYITYVNSISGTTDMAVTPQLKTTSGTVNLEPSAWIIAAVTVGDLSSTDRPGLNTGSTAAYAVVYHDGLYDYVGDYFDIALPTSITTDTFTVVSTKSAPTGRSLPRVSFPFDRSMNPLFDRGLLPGSTRAVSSQTVSDGSLHYFYVPR